MSYIILIAVAAWALVGFAIAGARLASRSRSGPLPPTRHPRQVRANDLT